MDNDEIDDIFGEEKPKELKEPTPKEPVLQTQQNVEKTVSNIVVKEKEDEESDDIPNLLGNFVPDDFLKISNKIRSQYTYLPNLDFDALYKEIKDLTVKSNATPTLHVMNDEIQKVQAAKDRLSEIFVDVLKCYNFKKVAVNLLFDSWFKFSGEKSADKRKGDATYIIGDFSLDLAKTEALFKVCTHVLRNLDSLQDTLSRRITIVQLQLKMMDFSKNSLPDADFSHTKKEDEYNTDDKKENDDSENSGKDGLAEAIDF